MSDHRSTHSSSSHSKDGTDQLIDREIEQIKLQEQEKAQRPLKEKHDLDAIDTKKEATTDDEDATPSDDKDKEKKKKEPSVPVHKLFRFATPLDFCLLAIASTFSMGVGVLQPVTVIIFSRFLGDLSAVLTDMNAIVDATRPMILVLVYLGTAGLVAGYVGHAIWVACGERQASRIRQKYVHAILRQDMAWFDKAEEGSLTTRLASESQIIQEGISEKFGNALQMIAQAISGIVIAFAQGWQLALVILATLPILVVVGASMGLFYQRFQQAALDSYADAGAVAEQVFGGIRTVASFSLQARFSRLYDKELDVACAKGQRRGLMLGVQFAIFMSVFFFTYGLAFWFGNKMIYEGHMNGTDVLIAFFSMMVGAFSFVSLPPNITAIASACAAAYRIFPVIDRVPDIDPDMTTGIQGQTLRGEIDFRHVDFAYPTRADVPVLHDFNLHIKAGQTVALVGSSGSGKSTCVQLLQRFYDPIQGGVYLDGHDIRDYNLTWYRRQIGVVSQEPVLFNMSIKKNLLMGATRKVTDEEMVQACQRANIHEFISGLPQGYDTLLGGQGGTLSGGQKQRISIARAIIRSPSILLLDEATSALDTQSERLVQQALEAASADRTTIVIAHRLSTIRNADLILVMDKGQVLEQGTHNELLSRPDSVYSQLVQKQTIAVKQVQGGLSETQAFLLDNNDDDDATSSEKRTAEEDPILQEKEKESHPAKEAPLVKVDSHVSSIDGFEYERRRKKEKKKRETSNQSTLKLFVRVAGQMRPEWPLLLSGLVGTAITGAIFPVLSLVLAWAITDLFINRQPTPPGPLQGSNFYAFLFVVVGIGALVGFLLHTPSFEIAGERYTRRLRSRLFRVLTKMEVAFFDHEDHSVGALTSMLAVDAKNVNEMVTKVWGDVANMVFCGIIGLVIAFVYNWLLTFITLTTAPFMMLAVYHETRVEAGFEDDTKRVTIETGEIAGEAIKEIRTVAGLTQQAYFEDRYAKAMERPHKLAIRKALLGSIGYAMMQAIMQYTYAVSYYAGVHLIQQNRLTFQELMVVMMAVMMTAQGLGRSTSFISSIVKARNSAISAFALLDRKPLVDMDMEGYEPASVKGDVAYQDVAFHYPTRPDIPIFSGTFNLKTDRPGQTIALVGPSGCGKSTTIGLLQRWYDPIRGQVLLDEHAVDKYAVPNLRSHMALVGQEPVLFDLSVADNIRFGALDTVTQEQIENAAKQANMHRFIESLPQGYETRVGDKGSQLSGGQKQRIAVARALIRNPRVLLLDEATSALDSESEKLVQAAIDNVLKEGGRTTITIAHRLSTIQHADVICVIENGEIVERGTHWELLERNGSYKKLVHQQALNVTQ